MKKMNGRDINNKFPFVRQLIRYKKEDLLINMCLQTAMLFLIEQYFIQKQNNIGDTWPGQRKNMMYFVSRNGKQLY